MNTDIKEQILACSAFILKWRLAADERRLTQMNPAIDAPRPFILSVDWRILAAH
jgi:hypothetical protein